MTRELRIVLPLRFDERIRGYCQQIFAGHLPHVRLTASFLLDAVDSTVSDYDQFRNAPFVLKAVQAAVRDGCAGVFLDVAFDTALSAAKTIAPIPVVGALEGAIAFARVVGRRFSILAINDEEVPVNHRLSREYGFVEQLVSVEPIGIPVHELRAAPPVTLARLEDATRHAIGKGAQAVVLGCTAMSWAATTLAERVGIPVLDTNLLGLYLLDGMTALGIRQSPLEYIRPSGFVPITDEEYAAMRALTFDIRSG